MTTPSLFGDTPDPEGSLPSVGQTDAPQSDSSPVYLPTSSLYRKYRPQSFSVQELVGQEHVVRTIRNAIALNRVAHAYLFSGPRGTGKTTTARLLAKAVNCLHDDPDYRPCNTCVNCAAINAGAASDIVEIDAASNRGIDDIRDLRERVRYAPSQLSSKVYIIDEAHQITGAAANAFLKTLEEPPDHTRFILATTDPELLLPTIVSRCQRFEFRRVGVSDIAQRLRTVADVEKIVIDDDALRFIARHATGSLRDALAHLEQVALYSARFQGNSSPGSITASDTRAALGLSHDERVDQLLAAIQQRDTACALRVVQEALDQGEDARQLNRQLLSFVRLLMIERSGGGSASSDRIREMASAFSLNELAILARRFGEIDFNIKHAPYPQLPLEIALVESTANPEPESFNESIDRDAPIPRTTIPRPATSLRERARGNSSIRELPPAQRAQLRPAEPAPVTPLRPDPSPQVDSEPRPDPAENFSVAHIADLWPSVRADVKAVNRRVEALLSEVDPVAVSGNQITLAVPYPFHRDKLNSDDVREILSSVLSRILERDVTLLCILRGEMTLLAPPRVSSNESESAIPTESAAGSPDDEERARIRLQAAINIFDAEEIADSPLVAQSSSSETV